MIVYVIISCRTCVFYSLS